MAFLFLSAVLLPVVTLSGMFALCVVEALICEPVKGAAYSEGERASQPSRRLDPCAVEADVFHNCA